jgi:hypothetical protein
MAARQLASLDTRAARPPAWRARRRVTAAGGERLLA